MKKEQSKIAIIAGARPNFMKVAPLCHEMRRQKMDYVLINTGQHFDKKMSIDFLKEFKIIPDYSLASTDSLHDDKTIQKKKIKQGVELIFKKELPSIVVVVGDVNSTFWVAQVAKKMRINLAHVEAGLRSFNNKMPEERNRIETDKISDFLFTTQSEALFNLRNEKVKGKMYFVGNIMIDSLKSVLSKAQRPVNNRNYYFCTLHRAENVDNKKIFSEIISALAEIVKNADIYLPLHPRTEKRAKEFGLFSRLASICKILPPLSYSESIAYQKYAKLILTDSGGIQEESSYIGVPCITLRKETERPITVKKGTNTIGGTSFDSILKCYKNKKIKKIKTNIPFWDGKTSKRITKILMEVVKK